MAHVTASFSDRKNYSVLDLFSMDGKDLYRLREEYSISQQLIETETGIPQSSIARFERTGIIPKAETVEKLKQFFSARGISNFEYPFTKDSVLMEPAIKPINKDKKPRLEVKPIHLGADPNDYDDDGTPFEDLGDGTIRMRVPVLPHKAFMGYARGFKDPEYYEELPKVSIEVLKRHRGTYLAFEVVGDSMITLDPDLVHTSIFPGYVAVGREVPRQQWAFKLHTHNYDNWIIVHKDEGILLKQIAKHDINKGVITIHSLNPKYEDEEFHLDDIQQIFGVVKVTKDLR